MKKPGAGPEAIYQSALLEFQGGRYREARKLLLGLNARHPNAPPVLRLLGMTECELGNYGEAIDCLGQVIDRDATPADLFNLGKALQLAHRLDEALRAHEAGLKLAPGNPTLMQARATTLLQMGHIERAEALLRELLAAEPGNLEAAVNLANALVLLRRPSEALELFKAASAADPSIPRSQSGPILRAKLLTADWQGFDEVLGAAVGQARSGRQVNPSALLTTVDDPELHLIAARATSVAGPQRAAAFALPKRDRIRLAYVSGDFRKHATTHLISEMLELHDRDRFEVVAVSFGPDDGSPDRKRVAAAADQFVDLAGASPAEMVSRVRSLDADIALDLMGHTARSADAAFGQRVAPVQVNFLGYPGTTGSREMDYIVLDRFIATDKVRRCASEKAVVLPHCYQPNDRRRPLPQEPRPRAAFGLPAEGFVFAAFNNTGKVTPAMFGAWMRILAAVEDSTLWLFATDPAAIQSLRREVAKGGLSAGRLVVAGHLPVEEHLARYLTAGLLLDTFPYGAHTTASDALWVGCPVVTLAGQSFASRVAGSLLHAVGLPELITHGLPEYEALAIALARDPERLAGLRRHLEDGRATAPLFDTPRYTRDLERAFAEMHRRRLKGLKPAPVDLTV